MYGLKSSVLIVYIVERVLFKVFNGVYRRTCTGFNSKLYSLMVYIVERVLRSKGLIVCIVKRVLFKVFNCVYRRTCTVQSV